VSRKHELKVQPPYFDVVADGSKSFEIRRNDRCFQTGDLLVLHEYDPDHGTGPNRNIHVDSGTCCLTGRSVEALVTFVYADDPRFPGLRDGFVALGLQILDFGAVSR
jgi:hypothetical protein